MEDIGLVLSGGGVRGIAHLGVLQALDELGIRPSVISGVSVGALIGALFAAGHTPEQILSLAKRESHFKIANIRFPGGLFSADNLRHILQELIPTDNFASLLIPLVVTSTDLLAGQSIIFESGPLHEPIIASCAIPLIFKPVKYMDYILVDGGVVNNLPVAPLRQKCKYVIGSHVNKLYNSVEVPPLGRLNVMERCFHMAISSVVQSQASLCDVFIEPCLSGYSMFDMRNADRLFEAGYNATLQCRQSLLNIQSQKL